MQEITFNVKFLSDIVLLATSNNEGNIDNLDFIPGSNFLGMVAKKYSEFEDSFKIFHSGKVRFGDATPIINDEATYKMPFSFFHEKLDESININHHYTKDFTKYTQLKQKRKGYITSDLKEIEIKHNYSQKSAYDKDARRSKDSTMYGYNALPSGSVWQFSVKFDDSVDSKDIEKVKNTLLGKQRLGKSKSSQYGLVEITEAKKAPQVECLEPKDMVILYAKSRLALVDEHGNPTYNVKYLLDDLKDENILWDKLQIRVAYFTPFNRAMQTKTYERLVINSGSVIVLTGITQDQIERLKQGVGAFLSEGFGEILINPSFLEIKDEFSFKNYKEHTKEQERVKITDNLVKFLNNREQEKLNKLNLANEVSNFIKENKTLYKDISNSQWGTIRSICVSFKDDYLKEIKEYISDGVEKWSQDQIDKLLENKNREFIHLLSIQMPKENK